MVNVREIISELRDVLASDKQVEQDRLVFLAKEYARIVEDVLKKAWRCRDLLNSGLRNQAIRTAKQDGDLKDDFEQIDFAEVPTWLDLCEKLELPLPPLVDTDAAQTIIEELYVESENLERLLQSYRRMSLGRAPIVDRLRKIREISQEDPGSDSWREDIRLFEQVRLEELARLAERANKEENLEALEQILHEILSEEWTEKPPAKFINAVDKLIQPHRQQVATGRYEQLLDEIRQAQSMMDEKACRSLMKQWKVVEKETGCLPPEQLTGQIQPVQAWLEELKEARTEDEAFERACAEIENSLDEEKDQGVLEKQAATVLRFGRDMPAVLAARFTSRMEELKRTGKRKFATRLTIIVGCVLLLGTGIGLSLRWYVNQQSLEHWEKQITVSLKRDDLEGTKKLLGQLADTDSSIYSSPTIQGLLREYRKKVLEEKERKKSFESLIAQVEMLEFIQSKSRNIGILDQAENLAKTLDEKLRAQKVREEVSIFDRKSKQEIEKEFYDKVRQLQEAYAKVQSAYGQEQEVFVELASACLTMAKTLQKTPDISTHLKAPITAVENGVQNLQKKRDEQIQQRTEAKIALGQLAGLYNQPSQLAKAAHEFRLKFAGHPAAEGLANCSRLAPQWESEVAWYRLAQDWTPLCNIKSETVKTRSKAIDAYQKSHPKSLHAEYARQYQEYLRAAEKAWASEELKYLAQTRELLSSRLMSELYVLQDRDGRCFYLKDKNINVIMMNGKPWRYTLEYIIDATLATRKESFKADEIEKTPKPAPQNAFAKKALALMSTKLQRSDWPIIYLRLAEMTRTQEELDPILKANLLRTFLSHAKECGYSNSDAIQKVLAVFSNIDIDLPWMDPNDQKASNNRGQVGKLVGEIRPLTSLISDVEKRIASLRKSFCIYKPAGVIVGLDGSVKLEIRLANCDLYVIWSEGIAPAQYIKIGKTIDGKFVADKGQKKRFPWGTIIFAKVR